MNDKTEKRQAADKPEKGFFSSLFSRLDQAMKKAADKKASGGCCCSDESKKDESGKGGKCC